MEKRVGKLVAHLKAERQRRGVSQVVMAKELDLNRRQYQRMEAGGMPAWMIEDACEVLGLKVLIVDKEVLK